LLARLTLGFFQTFANDQNVLNGVTLEHQATDNPQTPPPVCIGRLAVALENPQVNRLAGPKPLFTTYTMAFVQSSAFS